MASFMRRLADARSMLAWGIGINPTDIPQKKIILNAQGCHPWSTRFWLHVATFSIPPVISVGLSELWDSV